MIACLCCLFFASCENGDKEFDDYDYQTVYFAQQTPIRTITLGTDVYDTELDNQHKFQVMATVGGVWTNREDRHIQVAVDNSLCQGLLFSDGTAVTPLPESYYHLESNEIKIKKGDVRGGVTVDLTDAFFADPLALTVHYVLPLKIVSAKDSVLSGKDYILYAVKYKNKYDGCWLSHGSDQLTLDGTTTTVKREADYVEKYELRYLSSLSLQKASYPVTYTTKVNGVDKKFNVNLILTFDNSDQCAIITDTKGCTVSGSGVWTESGAKKAWGDKDRDLLQLKYDVTFTFMEGGVQKTLKASSNDELIMRDRQNKLETFSTK